MHRACSTRLLGAPAVGTGVPGNPPSAGRIGHIPSLFLSRLPDLAEARGKRPRKGKTGDYGALRRGLPPARSNGNSAASNEDVDGSVQTVRRSPRPSLESVANQPL